MSPRKNTKLPPEKLRELQVTAAVAREALMQMHVMRALRLIDIANNRVSVLRLIAIYTRVHALSNQDAEVLANRVLATVGHRARKNPAPAVYLDGEDANLGEARSIVGVVRDRLRGRVLLDLRRWVELHTGATQAALLDLHVRHGLRFVQELRDTHSISDALAVYADLVGVPGNMKDALYIFALDKLAQDELPKAAAQSPANSEQVPLFPPQRHRPKRVV